MLIIGPRPTTLDRPLSLPGCPDSRRGELTVVPSSQLQRSDSDGSAATAVLDDRTGFGDAAPESGFRMLSGGRPPRKVGRYLLEERLGSGGMGVVYSGWDPELARHGAVKLLQPRGNATDDTAARARLLREAQAMAGLNHPNVVSVFDVGIDDGRIYMAMERVDGTTLDQWLERTRRSYADILRVFLPAGRGLAAAHAQGFVRRDFKPHNVLLDGQQRVKVVDFGLAQAARGGVALTLERSDGDVCSAQARSHGRHQREPRP